ncbi:MAG: hypothetical protein LBC43_01630 [Bifidobacteriaceae bacterium]|jgi:Skp family chaperone for outer membrane proteins|nr:hypothetical protein [Bifidobacteriaceae bacterium]
MANRQTREPGTSRQRVVVYFKGYEYDELSEEAKKNDLSLSAYCHNLTTTKQSALSYSDASGLISELKEVKRLLANIAGNINQVAKAVNYSLVIPDDDIDTVKNSRLAVNRIIHAINNLRP